ncbi:hypothetical protein ANN_23593 [Periplaneta americana]|uniref:Transposable element Tc3 transposase n=1 Tax=Periplaneta americana TaxID=6978 RepID=A0ABQ8SMQ5_PERAM|nr:hypothetical protein ANN_23593 [Periplaneta americana]
MAGLCDSGNELPGSLKVAVTSLSPRSLVNQVVCLYHVFLNDAHRYCKLQLNDFNGYEKPLHAHKVLAWCAVSSTGIISPFFFENEAGNALTVNPVRYVEMIQNYFKQLARFPVNKNTLFQQGGGTSHTARISMDAVNALFPGRVVFRTRDIAWPSRSPDLTVWDFFLWGHLKTKVFGGNPPRTIPALKQRIREEVVAISVSMLRAVIQQFVARLEEFLSNKEDNMQRTKKKKELRKRLVKCFVWSMTLYGAETLTLRRSEEKRIEALEMWIWRRMERVKLTDRIRNGVMLEGVCEERMMLKLIRKRKRNWLGHWLIRNCLLKDALEGMVNGRKVRAEVYIRC